MKTIGVKYERVVQTRPYETKRYMAEESFEVAIENIEEYLKKYADAFKRVRSVVETAIREDK